MIPPAILVLAIVGLALVRALIGKTELHSDSALLMDTLVEVRVWGDGRVAGEAAVDSAMAVIARIDGLLSHGMVAGDDRETIRSRDVRLMLDAAAQAHALTGGLFDPDDRRGHAALGLRRGLVAARSRLDRGCAAAGGPGQVPGPGGGAGLRGAVRPRPGRRRQGPRGGPRCREAARAWG